MIFFAFIVLTGLLLDLHMHQADRPLSLGNAALWSAFWVAVSMVFASYVAATSGTDKAWLFVTGYLLEKSLSVDNLFVFMAVFASFKIRAGLQHRILYYGIVGALLLRLAFVLTGTTLLVAGTLSPGLHACVYGAFGALVLFSAWQMFTGLSGDGDDDEIEDYTNHWSVRLTRRVLPVTPLLDGNRFFTTQPPSALAPFRRKRVWNATPLFLCLMAIETSDVAFAFDSVPAVIAVTKDPFLIYSSNIFAILGLRSMYFLLAAAKRYLCHLEKAIVIVLVFIGMKLLIEGFHDSIASALGTPIKIMPGASLAFIAAALALGVIGSLVFPKQSEG